MLPIPPFQPHPLLHNPHAMTLVPRYWPQPCLLRGLPIETRLFLVSPDSRVLAYCHWQSDAKRAPTVILVTGWKAAATRITCLGSPAKHGAPDSMSFG